MGAAGFSLRSFSFRLRALYSSAIQGRRPRLFCWAPGPGLFALRGPFSAFWPSCVQFACLFAPLCVGFSGGGGRARLLVVWRSLSALLRFCGPCVVRRSFRLVCVCRLVFSAGKVVLLPCLGLFVVRLLGTWTILRLERKVSYKLSIVSKSVLFTRSPCFSRFLGPMARLRAAGREAGTYTAALDGTPLAAKASTVRPGFVQGVWVVSRTVAGFARTLPRQRISNWLRPLRSFHVQTNLC